MFKLTSIFIDDTAKVTSVDGPNFVDLGKDYETVSSAGKADTMPATKELVDQLIASDTVVIFSKKSCPFCKLAKQIFDKMQKKYTAIELDDRDDGSDIQDILADMTGARTVPRVFVKGVCLGGGMDIKTLYESGELEKKF